MIRLRLEHGVALLLFCVAAALLVPNLGQMANPLFDEPVYVGSARAMLQGDFSVNPEHPPLGKYFIALGIHLFGDTPFGWRFFSALGGALCVPVIFSVALRLLPGSIWVASFAALTFLFNQMHFVQSRLAMLETFALFWSWLAVLSYLHFETANKTKRVWRWGCITALCIGLAVATKWSGILTAGWISTLALRFFLRKPRQDVWRLAGAGILIALASYALCYWPMLKQQHFFQQWRYITAHSAFHQFHPYMSKAWQWPLLLQPVWYAMEPNAARTSAQFIFFQGNIVVFWGGLLALSYCAYRALAKSKRQENASQWIIVGFLWLYAAWFLVPRSTIFEYYYYLASPLLSLALANVVCDVELRNAWRGRTLAAMLLTLTMCCFWFFMPVMRGDTVSAADYPKWVWIDSWSLKTTTGAPALEQKRAP